MTFNNFIQMIVKIHEIALFNRATPGSSLVTNKIVLILCSIVFRSHSTATVADTWITKCFFHASKP